MINRIYLLVFCSVLLALSCSRKSTVPSAAIENEGLSELYELLTGRFSNYEQAVSDTSFYEVSLVMYPIWEKDASKWLYVEQALASDLDNPYRQRIYKIIPDRDKHYIIEVYKIPEAERFVGAWKNPRKFKRLSPDELIHRAGCEVYIQRIPGGTYVGGTDIGTCPSNMSGAAYATSEVIISTRSITTLDRGYDSNDEQVWGSTQGAYVFRLVAQQKL